jgi:D-serine deaminase-like pyridoxal phosphate-dependent protein
MDRRAFLTTTATGVAGAGLASASSLQAATQRAEEFIGGSMWDLPTPALVVDADVMEGNLRTMQQFLADKPAALRPHTKTHKSPLLAQKQMDHGAIGICTAKVSEAEVMLHGGIERILITSQVVTKDKIRSLSIRTRTSTI